LAERGVGVAVAQCRSVGFVSTPSAYDEALV